MSGGGKLVLVTGATGFLAAHVIEQLLEAGYRVRGTARKSKVPSLEPYKKPNLAFVAVDDIAKDDITEALKGVDIVMHVAAPLPGQQSLDDAINSIIEGSMNIVRQAHRAGILKLVVTGTFGGVLDPDLHDAFTGVTLKDTDWGKTSKEEIFTNKDNDFYVYFACKILAERAVWDYVIEHPELDVAIPLPGFIYGPWSKTMPLPSSISQIGSNYFANVIFEGGHNPTGSFPPWIVDVRDVAKSHLLALQLPPQASPLCAGGHPKRFLVNAKNFTWKDAAVHLKKARPHTTNIGNLESYNLYDAAGPFSSLDASTAREMGIEFIDPEKTMEDTVDAMDELKRAWSKKTTN